MKSLHKNYLIDRENQQKVVSQTDLLHETV